MFRRIRVKYADNCMSQRKLYDWAESIKRRQTRVDNDAHSV
jgi:hypothetical protein